jgi:hypothetical protein
MKELLLGNNVVLKGAGYEKRNFNSEITLGFRNRLDV